MVYDRNFSLFSKQLGGGYFLSGGNFLFGRCCYVVTAIPRREVEKGTVVPPRIQHMIETT